MATKVADMSPDTQDAMDAYLSDGDSDLIPQQQVIHAQAPQQRARPMFTLEALPPRKRQVTKCVRDDNGFRMTLEDVTDERPFMLRTMRGDRIYLSSIKELATYKLHSFVPVIDTKDADGEPIMNMTLAQVTTDKRRVATEQE